MPPEDVRAHLTRQWLHKASHDARAAALALDARDELWDIAAFHAQQTAEKALKGFLAWHSRPTRPTHNLVDLVERCEAIDATFTDLRAPAELLTRFAVDARYPGAVTEPDEATASEALQRANEVLEFMLAPPRRGAPVTLLELLADDLLPWMEAAPDGVPRREIFWSGSLSDWRPPWSLA